MRSISTMSDALLISALKAGDSHAIGMLMDRHRDSLMGFLVNRVGRDAEDLYQETWVRVSTRLDTYDEQGSFRAWLFQVARRLVIDHHRRSRSRISTVSDREASLTKAIASGQPDQALGANQMAVVFQGALDSMDGPMAEVVRLRLFDNLTFKEIALRQGVPLNTALGRMHRGLNQIRKALADHQFIDEGSAQ